MYLRVYWIICSIEMSGARIEVTVAVVCRFTLT